MTGTKYISERIWWCSNLPERDDGQETLRKLIEIERSAAKIPNWAVSIAEDNINYFPPCGHEMFEHNVNAILTAIKKQHKVKGFHYCFMVSKENPFRSDGTRSDYYDWDNSTENEIRKSGLSHEDKIVKNVKNTWLCAPKAFRFIEKIGNETGIQLNGFDSYSKHSFRAKIVDSLKKIETEIFSAEKDSNNVNRFLLTLLKAKLTEYAQNGMLQKVFKT